MKKVLDRDNRGRGSMEHGNRASLNALQAAAEAESLRRFRMDSPDSVRNVWASAVVDLCEFASVFWPQFRFCGDVRGAHLSRFALHLVSGRQAMPGTHLDFIRRQHPVQIVSALCHWLGHLAGVCGDAASSRYFRGLNTLIEDRCTRAYIRAGVVGGLRPELDALMIELEAL